MSLGEMDGIHDNLLQKFDDSHTEILKRRLLKSSNTTLTISSTQSNQNKKQPNTVISPMSSTMVSQAPAPQTTVHINNSITHPLAPIKIKAKSTPYPVQLSRLPVQMAGSCTNFNIALPLNDSSSSAPSNMNTNTSIEDWKHMQVSMADNLSAPILNQNIIIPASTNAPMTILQTPNQPIHNSLIQVPTPNSLEPNISNASQIPNTETNNIQMKMSNPAAMGPNPVVQVPNSSNNAIQLQLPNSTSSGTAQRGSARSMPQVVYIQTSSGLKPVTNTEVISQASSSGNPPQIIVRRPVTSASGLQVISNTNKPIAPKVSIQKKSSVLAPVHTAQPIVIQKPKGNEKMLLPIAGVASGKSAITYLGTVKKSNTTKLAENQSILLPNNQLNSKTGNQKLFIAPMNMPKIPNTKFILPVTVPAMSSKGPFINLQIANGQLQNDPQGNITVMRDTVDGSTDASPLQPITKIMNSVNGIEASFKNLPQNSNPAIPYGLSIPGSRAEPTGDHEYILSIPETNANLNDDIYTVSIADEDSYTLAIPEKNNSLLNPNLKYSPQAISKRSNSDNSDKKSETAAIKRRMSLCSDPAYGKRDKNSSVFDGFYNSILKSNNDDHKVPSLFCDEKLEKDLELKPISGKEPPRKLPVMSTDNNSADLDKRSAIVPEKRSSSESTSEEDPPGLTWTNGVAVLQGSNLQFQTNEFGLIDIVDDQTDNYMGDHSMKYSTPLKQRIDRVARNKPASPEDLYCCDGCGCHGMAAEFITPNFCSHACQEKMQRLMQKRARYKPAARERLDLMKKNKFKKSLIKKQDEKDDRFPENNPEVVGEDFAEDCPWMFGATGFSWAKYLDHCGAKEAPLKLFRDPFPYTKNGFKVGMRMEVSDPRRPALFRVASAAEVQGHRIRLHLDGEPPLLDYWTDADSPDLFPFGWCDRTGRVLQPPTHLPHDAPFSWPLYLKQIKAVAAPKHLFPHLCSTSARTTGFRIGMKLEAEERNSNNNNSVCVATVVDMLDNRILVHLDGWDDTHDYWTEPNSPHIHPVGWAQQNSFTLMPPKFYKDPTSFTWEAYLSDTGSVAVPARFFKPRPPAGFKIGMKLEVVDVRVPFLIRVASVSAVRGHQVRVSYDGWPDELSTWLRDDAPELHPVGYCLKTTHPLEPPLTAEEARVAGPCGVAGCRGLGSLLGGAYKSHASSATCPYRPPAPEHRRVARHKPETATDSESAESCSGPARRRRRRLSRELEDELTRDYPARSSRLRLGFSRGAPLQPLLVKLTLTPDPALWTQDEVASLVSEIAGDEAAQSARAARMLGADLLTASCEELVVGLSLRLGPALKLYGAAHQLRDLCVNTDRDFHTEKAG